MNCNDTMEFLATHRDGTTFRCRYAPHFVTAYKKDNKTGKILAFIIQPTVKLKAYTGLGHFRGLPTYIVKGDTVHFSDWSMTVKTEFDFRALRENIKTEYMLQCLR